MQKNFPHIAHKQTNHILSTIACALISNQTLNPHHMLPSKSPLVSAIITNKLGFYHKPIDKNLKLEMKVDET